MNELTTALFYNIFSCKSCAFLLQTRTNFEVTKPGSGVGFLRLTAAKHDYGAVSLKANQIKPSDEMKQEASMFKAARHSADNLVTLVETETNYHNIFISASWKSSKQPASG